MLVCKNYLKHGFKNILLSDLNDKRISEISSVFNEHSYIIITLYSENDEIIKERILNRKNGNEFKDYEKVMKINANIKNRIHFQNEFRIKTDRISIDESIKKILETIK